MVASVFLADDVQTVPMPLEGEHRPTRPVPLQTVQLLYGLSLAIALPPAAWLPPQSPALPAISPTPGPIIAPAELRAALARPVTEVGRGRIVLGEVERRLRGLSLSLDLFRAGSGKAALVAIGIVQSDQTTSEAGAAMPADLWRLAREAMPRHGRVRPVRPGAGAGPNSVFVHYGRATAQLAWLASDNLATVSVTGLHGDERQMTEIAYAVAHLLTSRPASRAFGR